MLVKLFVLFCLYCLGSFAQTCIWVMAPSSNGGVTNTCVPVAAIAKPGPAGPIGPQGPQGVPGPAGPAGTALVGGPCVKADGSAGQFVSLGNGTCLPVIVSGAIPVAANRFIHSVDVNPTTARFYYPGLPEGATKVVVEIDPLVSFNSKDPEYRRDENDTAVTMKRSTLFTDLKPGVKYRYRAVVDDQWLDYGAIVTPLVSTP